jgi:hypothetical protein
MVKPGALKLWANWIKRVATASPRRRSLGAREGRHALEVRLGLAVAGQGVALQVEI